MGGYESRSAAKGREQQGSPGGGVGGDRSAVSQAAQAAELRALSAPVQMKGDGEKGDGAADAAEAPDPKALYERIGDRSASELSLLASMVDEKLGSSDPATCLRCNVGGLDVGEVSHAELAFELEQAAARRGVTSELAAAVGAVDASGKDLFEALATQEDLRALAERLDDELFPGGSVDQRLAPTLPGGGAYAANELVNAAERRGVLKEVAAVADELCW